jgi:hypothetical protein
VYVEEWLLPETTTPISHRMFFCLVETSPLSCSLSV